jgi:hypothetical protein
MYNPFVELEQLGLSHKRIAKLTGCDKEYVGLYQTAPSLFKPTPEVFQRACDLILLMNGIKEAGCKDVVDTFYNYKSPYDDKTLKDHWVEKMTS